MSTPILVTPSQALGVLRCLHVGRHADHEGQ
jgi:hypothetical protein